MNERDFLVEGLPLSVRHLRDELQRALGCNVAIYFADCLAAETRDRKNRETVDLIALDFKFATPATIRHGLIRCSDRGRPTRPYSPRGL